MSLDRPSLADAFKGKGGERASGLSDLLAPAAPPTSLRPEATSAPTTVEPAERPAAPSEKVKPAKPAAGSSRGAAPAAPARATPTRAPTAVDSAVKNTGVYIEGDLLELIRAEKLRRSSGGVTPNYDELLVLALDNVGEAALRTAFAVEDDEPKGGLMPARRRRPRGTAGIQVQLRLDDAQRASLDSLARTVGAPSRSALVATAYRLWLQH